MPLSRTEITARQTAKAKSPWIACPCIFGLARRAGS